jgi:hypothetical protein
MVAVADYNRSLGFWRAIDTGSRVGRGHVHLYGILILRAERHAIIRFISVLS